jgi:hypothetical protein
MQKMPCTMSRQHFDGVVKHDLLFMNFHSSYRPDIDGLRAVAILLVIGFHAYPTSISGGLVDVDVFFVISDYLISSIIFKSPNHRISDCVIPLNTSQMDGLSMKKASSLGIKFYSPKDEFCNKGDYLTNVTDKKGTKKVVNFDRCHFTDDGSALFAKSFVDKLELPLLLNSKLD